MYKSEKIFNERKVARYLIIQLIKYRSFSSYWNNYIPMVIIYQFTSLNGSDFTTIKYSLWILFKELIYKFAFRVYYNQNGYFLFSFIFAIITTKYTLLIKKLTFVIDQAYLSVYLYNKKILYNYTDRFGNTK